MSSRKRPVNDLVEKEEQKKKEQKKVVNDLLRFCRDTTCSICFGNLNTKKKIFVCPYCAQCFHQSCITKHEIQQNEKHIALSCPLCRMNMYGMMFIFIPDYMNTTKKQQKYIDTQTKKFHCSQADLFQTSNKKKCCFASIRT
jgi:hypothetical protein